MESWRKTWRYGFAPQLSVRGLNELHKALVGDDPRLLQGATTSPPPLQCVEDWPVEAACGIGICGVAENDGFGEAVVADVEEYFAKACFECDKRLGEPSGCRWFLNWFDETPREQMRRELIPEVERSLELLERAQG